MNLYLDDNCVKASLAAFLRRAGRHVTLPADLGMAGATDARHLASCAARGLAILTRDHDDFLDLHDMIRATHGSHAGILVLRMDNDPARDMKDRIVRAPANLEAAQIPVANDFHILDHWR
jgi:predicted nuclease of predicted toxin-antitoxin system